MEKISIAGLDRISAHELKEIFEANGEAHQINLSSTPRSSGKAGSLEGLTAEMVGHSSEIILLLTVWIASKKSFSIEVTQESPGGEKKTKKIEYRQDGAANIIKTLRDFFAKS